MNYLLLFQLITHLSVVLMLYYGQWYHYLISVFVYFITGCFGMTVTYHRLLSHRSFNPIILFEKIGTLCGVIGGTGSSIAWVAIHREHHRFTDTDKDPHSPHHGFLRVQFLSMLRKPNIKYVPDLLRSDFHLLVHRQYWSIHAVYAGILWIILGPFALVYAYLFPSFILWHAGSFINTLGHYDGKVITPANRWWLGIIMWGEGYHKNHPDRPASPNFGDTIKWYNIDIGYYFIKTFLSKK